MKKILVIFFLVILSFDSFALDVDFFPKKRARGASEVRLRFSEPIAPIGDPSFKFNPIKSIDCISEKIEGVWEEPALFVMRFKEPLKAGLRCSVTLVDEIKSQSGAVYSGSRVFVFDTDVVLVDNIIPSRYQDIQNEQTFLFSFTGDVDIAKNKKQIYFKRGSTMEYVEAEILSEEDTRSIINEFFPYLSKSKARYFGVKPKIRFADGEDIFLIFHGIESTSGIKTDFRQEFKYRVMDGFKVTLGCERESEERGCIPISAISVEFSHPVDARYAESIYIADESGKRMSAVRNEEDELISRISFKPPFIPEQTYMLYIPTDIKDIYGRNPVNADRFPLKFKVDRMPPLAKFPSLFGIVEMIDGEAVVPVTIRGLEKDFRLKSTSITSDAAMKTGTVEKGVFVRLWEFIKSVFTRLFGRAKRESVDDDYKRYLIPDVKVRSYNLSDTGIPRMFEIINKSVRDNYAVDSLTELKLESEETRLSDYFDFKETTVVGIPLKRYGLYLFEIESKVLGDILIDKKYEEKRGRKTDGFARIHSVVLATNMAVTFKRGEYNSLVFVNRLNDGQPVSGAEINIYDCKGNGYFSGTTNQDGVLIVDKVLPDEHSLPRCEYLGFSEMKLSSGLTVVAKSGGDISFVNSRWDRGIESYRFNVFGGYSNSPVRVHSVLSRNLLRAGERLHIRTYMRHFGFKDIRFADAGYLPKRLIIEHSGSRKVWEFDTKWDEYGTSLLEWDIPRDAPTGYYNIRLEDCNSDKDSDRCSYSSGSFSVEEFKVPLIKGELVIKDPQNDKIRVEGLFNYLMGAPANNMDITLRYRVESTSYLNYEQYKDYTFATGRVRSGIKSSYNYQEDYPDEDGYIEPESQNRRDRLPELVNLKTDDYGRFSYEVNLKRGYDKPIILDIEAGYTDPNGYFYTISQRKTVYPSPYIVGITGNFDNKKNNLETSVVVISQTQKPLSGVSVKVNLYQDHTYTHRKKVIGGFYSYESVRETKFVREVCSGKTNSSGKLDCKVEMPLGGDYKIEAIAGTEDKTYAATSRSIYTYYYGDEWFDYSSDSDRIDLFVEKKDYKPSEKVTIKVNTPFEKSTALITIEREGILDYYIRELDAKNPYITIPAKPEYSPNVYISVMLIRGRISSPPPTFLVDLAKPSFKMGLVEINVDKEKYKLNLKVVTEREKYLVRDSVSGYVELSNPNSNNTNVMLIVVDEGLLELKENNTYDLLNGIIWNIGYNVKTYTGMIQVIGKRHYGKKALPSGGGGGRIVTRELFDTLIYFNPSLKIIGNKAHFQFRLNDSITSFKIIAVAISGSNQFGTSFGTIKSYREIFINSSIPYFAREKDRFRGEFVIKSTTDREKILKAKGYVSFTKDGKEVRRLTLADTDVSLKKGGNEIIGFDIEVPEGVNNADYVLDLFEGNSKIDSIKVSQKIVEAYLSRVVQSTFFRLKGSYKNIFKMEADRLVGRLKVAVMRDINEMGNSLKLYKGFTLACLEQKVSYSIVANDYEYFKSLMNEIELYIDENGLLKYYPTSKEGSVMLTAYIMEITRLNGFQLPESVIDRCVDGLSKFILGRINRKNVYTYTTSKIERLFALSAINSYIKNGPELLKGLDPKVSELPLSSIVDIGNITPKDKDIYNAIITNFNEKGDAFFMNENRLNNLWWLMRSEDEAFARSLIYLVKNSKDETLLGKMMRGFMNRFERGYLYNTMAHSYAAVAFRLFSEKFKTGIKDSTIDVSYRCNSYKESIGKDYTSHNFIFDILSDNSVMGGEHMSNCDIGQDYTLSMEDKKNNYWVWVMAEKSYAMKEPVFKGFRITKEYLDEKGKSKSEFKKTDIVRVRLTVDADSYYNNIVLKDPLITGSDVVGRIKKEEGLQQDFEDYYWYYTYSDVRDGLIRTYYEHPYSTRIVFEYKIRLNTRGVFNLPPTRVELMYMPDVYGEIPNETIEVK